MRILSDLLCILPAPLLGQIGLLTLFICDKPHLMSALNYKNIFVIIIYGFHVFVVLGGRQGHYIG